MPDNYSYFQNENTDGIDYFFISRVNLRLYTVSFDNTIYADYVENFSTLLKFGYGVVFSFKETKETLKGESVNDDAVCLTIIEIINDFLSNKPEGAFVIYECSDYKEHKLFRKWFEMSLYKEITVKTGFTIEFEDNPESNIYFGYITQIDNLFIDDADKEMYKFIASSIS